MRREDLHVGQEVVVTHFWRRRPETGPGFVTKIARKYVTIRHQRGTEEFVIETGAVKTSYSPHSRFRTVEQAALDARQDAAVAALKEHGVTYAGFSGYKLTVAQLEAMVTAIETNQNPEGNLS
jgi:P2-related tail formation protein